MIPQIAVSWVRVSLIRITRVRHDSLHCVPVQFDVAALTVLSFWTDTWPLSAQAFSVFLAVTVAALIAHDRDETDIEIVTDTDVIEFY